MGILTQVLGPVLKVLSVLSANKARPLRVGSMQDAALWVSVSRRQNVYPLHTQHLGRRRSVLPGVGPSATLDCRCQH